MSEFPIGYNQGWICPKCGRCFAPSQPFCLFCMPQEVKPTGHSCTCGTESKCNVHKPIVKLED